MYNENSRGMNVPIMETGNGFQGAPDIFELAAGTSSAVRIMNNERNCM